MKNFLKAAALITAMYGVALAQNTTPSSTEPAASQSPSTTTPSSQTRPQATQAPVPSSATSASQPANKTKIAPGSVIPVQLTKTVDAKKAKTGDEVVAKVTMDMKTQSGDVLVPKDTKVIGHVTEAQPRSKEQKESQLAIAFDRAVTKDGNDMQVPMSIQAIIGQQNNNENAAGGGGNEPAAAPSGGGTAGSSAGGRSPMTGGSSPNTAPSPSAGSAPSDSQTASNGGRPPINAQTQGVIGISNLTLASGANGSQGSMMTSEKNNVKLESGTMLLLKVNQQ